MQRLLTQLLQNVGKSIMANGRLLDTNIIIDYLKNKLPTPLWFSKPHLIFVSQITIGELLFGAELSAKSVQNKNMYINFCNKFQLLPVNFATAQAYAKIKATLRKLGTPIPENDMWIAATALAFDLAIVTGDRHFERVPNLQVEYV